MAMRKNKWLDHLNKYRRRHPKVSLTAAMVAARKTYRRAYAYEQTHPKLMLVKRRSR